MAQCVSNRCKDLFKRKKYFGVMGTLIPCSLHLAVSRPLTCTFQTEVIKKLSRNRWLSFIVVQWWQVDKICILYDCKSLTPDRRLLKNTLRALFYGIVIWGESTKHGPLVHGPPPWTRSMDRVHQNVDRVHGPPFMDRVHGLPYHGPGPWTPYFYKLRLHHKLWFDDLWWHVAWWLQFQ